MQCAVVQDNDNVVINIIVAVPSDIAPIRCSMVRLQDEKDCGIGWIYDKNSGCGDGGKDVGDNQFISYTPVVAAKSNFFMVF